MFDQVIEKAAELYVENDQTVSGDIMYGSSAWTYAVTEVVKTTGDAIGLALDITDLPQLQNLQYAWDCDGADNLFEFLRSAFYGMGQIFEPAVAAKVGLDTYNALTMRRRDLGLGPG